MSTYIVNSIIYGLILLNSTNEVIDLNIKEMNKILLALFLILYYLLSGLLYYIYMVFVEPENKETWYAYFYLGFRFRIGLAIVLALITMYAIS